MGQAQGKAALVDQLRREKAYWEALLRVVEEQDMDSPGVMGDWTFKDAVAHLTGWRKRTVARIAGSQQRGQPLPPEWPAELDEEQPDTINAWIYGQNHDRPLADVLAESQQVWEELVAVVEETPEEDLLEPGHFEWLEGHPLGPAVLNGSFGHLHEHAALINDWLARRFDQA